MHKAKFMIFTLLFIFISLLTTNVNAEMVSYGWRECDYSCHVAPGRPDSILTDSDWVDGTCEDQWSYNNNFCKKSDGSFFEYSPEHNDELIINFGADGNIISVETDLFGEGADKYQPSYKDIDKLGIKSGEKNVFMYDTQKMFNSTEFNDGILFSVYYVHNYKPIVDYYKKAGKYPDYIVADETGYNGGFLDLVGISYMMYTYYPSDYKTTEHELAITGGVSGWVKMAKRASAGVLPDTSSENRRNIEYCKLISPTPDDFWCKSSSQYSDIGTDKTTVHRYFARNLSTSANLYACDDMDADFEYLKKLYEELGEDNETYKNARKQFDDDCEKYWKKTYKNANSRCYNCKDLVAEIAKMDPSFTTKTNYCGFGDDMIAWLLRVLKILRYIVPVLVIVLSIFDYIGAIMSDQDDAIKKAGGRLGKRLFIMILFLAMPSIIQFLLNVFHVDGLSSSNPYCLKK